MLTFHFKQRRTLRGKRWFWNLRAANGKIIADGGEGYVNFEDCQATVFLIQREAATANSEGDAS